ncbi:germin subfamily 1 member 15 [Salmonella enterica subsp. enterica serovar Choleraesuis]|nr:germin subfamily 1 member 15 [Salmonella enterica subsp. enterica serovar Choleraesuis]
MNLLATMSLVISSMAAAGVAAEEKIQLTPNGSKPSVVGPESWFTGKVRIDAPFQASKPATVGGATVTFEPGARTAWHTHPLGQTLIVTQGKGWVQEWGHPAREMNAGDIIWIPEGVKHWHGATAQTAMSHIAISEAQNGSVVEWLEHVSDEQYSGA